MDWISFADVNFIDHGGSYVKREYDDDTLVKYPRLKSLYQVLHIDPVDDDRVLAYMKLVDIDDYGQVSDDIKDIYGTVPVTEEEKAYYFADYRGLEPSVDTSWKQKGMYAAEEDYFLTKEEARDWCRFLHIPIKEEKYA